MEAHFTGLDSLHITIAGLGLMGGSLALALRGQCQRLSGVENDPTAEKYALDNGLVEEIISFEQALDSDLLVLAAPVSGILEMLNKIQQGNPPGPLVVIDLGSTKVRITQAMQVLPAGCDPIGGHPMCGKESSGAENAEAGLFHGCNFILTPLKRTSSRAREIAQALVVAAGGQTLILEPEEHDRLAAFASHVPYLAATVVVQAAEAAGDERVWQVAASGFRDTTRLAVSNLGMMTDILLTNPGPVLEALGAVREALDRLAVLIQNGDAQALTATLEQARNRRRRQNFKRDYHAF